MTDESTEGLPDSLIAQLTKRESVETRQGNVLNVLKDDGGIMSIDKVLIAYWRKHDEVLTRQAMVSDLYLLKRSEKIHSPYKGTYAYGKEEAKS